MDVEDVKKIAVIGAGSMGHGIAEVATLAGYEVNLVDTNRETLESALDNMKKSLELLVEIETIPRDAPGPTLGRIQPLVDLGKAVRDSDFVIEAVTEKAEVIR